MVTELEEAPKDNPCSVLLSICISTFNRGEFIGETLDSIICQLIPGVELVVVDGCSQDKTPEVMEEYLSRYPEIRYYREPINSGVDSDYDKAVSYARGKFCWLMPDDDLMLPGALTRVLSSFDDIVELVIVDAEVKNANLTKLLWPSMLKLSQDLEYNQSSQQRFFTDTAEYLSFIGCVIIRRDIWLEREREIYFGTLFIHVGVIFQNPPLNLVRIIAGPLITIRLGNALWTPRAFNIWMFKWPDLIWGFDGFTDSAKKHICWREPYKKIRKISLFRAKGAYSKDEYRKYFSNTSGFLKMKLFSIAFFPARLANLLAVIVLSLKKGSEMEVYELSLSRHSTALSRWLSKSRS